MRVVETFMTFNVRAYGVE